MGQDVRSEIVPEIRKNLAEFRRLQRLWFTVHYGCGLAGVIAGILAASPKIEFWLWGVIAAVSIGAVTFLGPLQKGDSYKHAYYRLRNAIARYESMPTIGIDWLLDEYQHAQGLVLSRDTDLPPTARYIHS